jgi:DAK2 domain fusion protein YloV
VFRESSEYAAQHAAENTGAEQLLEILIESAKIALAKTKEMLPVLAQADVVDSGGAGYLAMLVGMYDALTGKVTDLGSYESVQSAKPAVNYDLFTADSVLEWGYCTEALVRLQTAKGDPEDFDVNAFKASLEAKACNSIVALRDGDVLKVHAHTMTPADVLTLCQQFGEFLEVKIENMSLQHSEKTVAQEQKKKVHKLYGVIAVASGEGMHTLFSELGADIIIDGGQTANPSAGDFVDAIGQLDCDHVLLLPNNGNILLTAQQAATLCEGIDVRVVPTKSFPQGYSALAVFNSELDDADEQVEYMTEAKNAVVSGEITYAIRDTVIGDVAVKKGEVIGILDGKLVCSLADEQDAMCAMLAKIEDIEDREILSLFVGADVTEDERAAMTEAIEQAYEDLTVEVFVGGQQVYRYLVAVE